MGGALRWALAVTATVGDGVNDAPNARRPVDPAGHCRRGGSRARRDVGASLRAADSFLQGTLLPHEDAEDSVLYPALAAPLGSPEATATMSRMHAEIHRLAERLHRRRELADEAGTVRAEQVDDLLACLYGLYALLCLHFVQEEENFFVLAPTPAEHP